MHLKMTASLIHQNENQVNLEDRKGKFCEFSRISLVSLSAQL